MSSSGFLVPSLCVVVPTWNRSWQSIRLTQKCLSSLMATSDPDRLEMVVSDAGSPNWDPREWYGPPVKVAVNPNLAKPLGFAQNCNQGAKLATASWLFFLNSDTEASPGWLEEMLKAIAEHPQAILGPKLLFPPGPEGIPRLQSVGGLYDVGKHPFHRYLSFRADGRLAQEDERVSWTTGAAMAMPRALFEALGGFDEAYERGYFEDADFCERAKKRFGTEIWYIADARFVHHVAQSSQEQDEKGLLKAARCFQHNRWLFHSRHDTAIEPDIGSVVSPST